MSTARGPARELAGPRPPSVNRLLTICLCLLVGAGVLAAAPAGAAVWKDNGVNVDKHIEIQLVGGEVFEIDPSGMSCEVAATITTSGGSTGIVTKWQIKNCKDGFGQLAGCQVQSVEPKNLPWTLHVNATDLLVTGMRIRRTFKAGCPIAEIDKTVSMTLTPDSCKFTTLDFSGSTTGYDAFGVLEPLVPTYGIC